MLTKLKVMKVIILEEETYWQHIQDVLKRNKDTQQIGLGGSITPGFTVV